MLSDDRNTGNVSQVLRQKKKDWTENAYRNENEAVRYNNNNLGQ